MANKAVPSTPIAVRSVGEVASGGFDFRAMAINPMPTLLSTWPRLRTHERDGSTGRVGVVRRVWGSGSATAARGAPPNQWRVLLAGSPLCMYVLQGARALREHDAAHPHG
jgi:hypothetical protein